MATLGSTFGALPDGLLDEEVHPFAAVGQRLQKVCSACCPALAKAVDVLQELAKTKRFSAGRLPIPILLGVDIADAIAVTAALSTPGDGVYKRQQFLNTSCTVRLWQSLCVQLLPASELRTSSPPSLNQVP